MRPVVRPVILSGGQGTRLWPLSTPDAPKQFLGLLGDPLFSQALGRLSGFSGAVDPVVVTSAAQLELINKAVAGTGVAVHRILIEPEGRNTAPAAIAAAATLDPEEVLVVLPADHLIADQSGFWRAVESGVELASEDKLVTFGVTPNRPETGYGYIEAGQADGAGFEVVRFVEKPALAQAEGLISQGGHYWNSGIFVFKAGVILDEARRFVPEVVDAVLSSLGEAVGPVVKLGSEFLGVDGVSIDVAVMERTDRARVIPVDVGWTDVGSWRSVWEASESDHDGNVIVGDVSVIDSRGSYLRSDGTRLAVVGLDEVVVVVTADAVLVAGMDASQRVGELNRLVSDD